MATKGYLEGDEKTMEFRREILIDGAYGFFMEVDQPGRRLFLASFFTGELYALDLCTLVIAEIHPLTRGIRNMSFDKNTWRLYITDYFRGDLIVFDADENWVIDRIFVGRIARHPQLDAAGKEIVIRTSAGVFAVTPNKSGKNPPNPS